MAGKKLTLVVTCTDRKSRAPAEALRVRNLEGTDVSSRLDAWRRGLARPGWTTEVRDLYAGQSWTGVVRLMTAVQAQGFDPRLVVVSAGLGLRRGSDRVPSYAATFSAGQPDSVASTNQGAVSWWSGLPHTAWDSLRGPALWVLSDSYSRIVGQELQSRGGCDDLVVFGGSDHIRPERRVRADKSLRQALGGTATTLNIRAAIRWVESASGQDLFSSRRFRQWEDWRHKARRVESYDRTPVSDEAVRSFISTLRSREPHVSRSRALTALRASGLACEQKRFGRLFIEEARP